MTWRKTLCEGHVGGVMGMPPSQPRLPLPDAHVRLAVRCVETERERGVAQQPTGHRLPSLYPTPHQGPVQSPEQGSEGGDRRQARER